MYTSHFTGSGLSRGGSKEIRNAFSGEIFLIESKGSKANKTEIIIPNASPCITAGHETGYLLLPVTDLL